MTWKISRKKKKKTSKEKKDALLRKLDIIRRCLSVLKIFDFKKQKDFTEDEKKVLFIMKYYAVDTHTW